MGVKINVGVTKLARELGVMPYTVTRLFQRGFSEEEIRARVADPRNGNMQKFAPVRFAKLSKEAEQAAKDAEVKAERALKAGKAAGQVVGQVVGQAAGQAVGQEADTQEEPVEVAPPTPTTLTTPTGPPNRWLEAARRAQMRVTAPPREHSDTDADDTGDTGDTYNTDDSDNQGSQADETHMSADRRKAIALANERELRVAQMRAELVPIGTINAWFGKQIVAARDALMRIGAENRDILAGETDPAVCERIVEDAVRAALDKLRPMPQPQLTAVAVTATATQAA